MKIYTDGLLSNENLAVKNKKRRIHSLRFFILVIIRKLVVQSTLLILVYRLKSLICFCLSVFFHLFSRCILTKFCIAIIPPKTITRITAINLIVVILFEHHILKATPRGVRGLFILFFKLFH